MNKEMTFPDFVVIGFLALLIVPGIVAGFVPQLAARLLQVGVLTNTNIPITGTGGLDFTRTLIGVGVLLAIIIGIASRSRHA